MVTSVDPIQAQKVFLEKVKYILPSNISFVDELCEILEISIDSVYRRIRGETALTFDEILKLCNRFNLSFDSLVESNAMSVTFSYNILPRMIEGFKHYLRAILEDLKALTNFPGAKIIYVAEDIPLFHLFNFPELAAFKMYYWMKSVLNVPEYQDQKYSFENTDKEILEIGAELVDAYTRVNSVEMWTEYTVNSLRKQIEYYWEAGLFENPADSLLICDQAAELVKKISLLAEKSSKLPSGTIQNFMLYYSEIEIGNNCILADVNNFKKVYLTYNTFNDMFTTNEKFCEETNTWINFLITKSILISGVSEKQRLQFVNKTVSQLNATREKVKNLP